MDISGSQCQPLGSDFLDQDHTAMPLVASHPNNENAGLLWASLVTLNAPNHLCGLASVSVAAFLAAASMTAPSLWGRTEETDGVSVQGGNCQSWRGGLNVRRSVDQYHASHGSNFLLFSCSVVSDSLQPHGLQAPGFPVLHLLLELAQTHIHWVSDAIHPLILCCPHLDLASTFPSVRIFSNESALRIRWPKSWRFSFSIIPSNEYSGPGSNIKR